MTTPRKRIPGARTWLAGRPLNANPQPNPTMQSLSNRELATILAALRYWQGMQLEDVRAFDCETIATDGGTLEPLEPEEIDALCERLNTAA